jgi:hypothetical protein
MTFGTHSFKLAHESGFELHINSIDSLRSCAGLPKTPVQVAVAHDWQTSLKKNPVINVFFLKKKKHYF